MNDDIVHTARFYVQSSMRKRISAYGTDKFELEAGSDSDRVIILKSSHCYIRMLPAGSQSGKIVREITG